MFCKNCGKEIADNSTFCPYCGTNVGQPQAAPAGQQPQAQPVYVAPKKPIFSPILKWFKSVFSSNAIKGLGEAAVEDGPAGIIGLLIEDVLIAFGVAIMIVKVLLGLASFAGGSSLISSSFGSGLVANMVFSLFFQHILVVAFVLAALFGALCLVFVANHKQVKVKGIFAVMCYSLIPVALAGLASIILLAIEDIKIIIAIVILLHGTALFIAHVLLYTGIQKLEKFEKSPFMIVVAFTAAFLLVLSIIGGIDVNISKNNIENTSTSYAEAYYRSQLGSSSWGSNW